MPGDDGVLAVTRKILAPHAAEPSAPYLSLLARRPDVAKAELEEALCTRHDLVRVNCMRAIVHIVPAADLPCFVQAYAAQPASLRRRSNPQPREH